MKALPGSVIAWHILPKSMRPGGHGPALACRLHRRLARGDRSGDRVANDGVAAAAPHVGQAPIPCLAITFSATRICSSRVA